MSDNWVVQNLENALEVWNNKLSEIWQLITQSPETFKGGSIWAVVTDIHGALQAIGYALLVLFFVVGVVKTCGSFTDLKKPEHVVKLFVRFAIAKGLITYGMELMMAILEIVQGVVSTIMNSAGFGSPQATVLPSEIVTAIEDCGFFESIPLWAVTLIGGLFIWVLSFVMILSVYGRFFKMYMYTAIAPVPLSSFAGEPSQNIGRSFLKSYAYINAVIGQGKHNNQSFFAFTATPKGESLELFGVTDIAADGTPIHRPFHVYSMRQAIEEGFILDVLKYYTTIKEAFKLIKVSDDNPELIEGPTSKALFKYYKQHGYTITQKTEMIMTNFLENCRYQIDGKGKAMVVADSRANAVRYYFAIKQYLKDHPEESKGSDVMIAFSGEISLPDMPSEKPYTEAAMNLDENGKYITTDKKFRKSFHSSLYNILVVANKYQTGFDEPLLHTMYVDKKLKDITAVQTLSRLNRTAPGKQSTFVLDFENTEEDIRKSFLPYYEITTMEGDSDINRVYDLRSKIASFMLYNFNDVETFIGFMGKHSGVAQTEASIGRLAGLLRPVIDRYKDLSEDERYTVRDYIRKFNGAYSYVTQLVRLHDQELFNEFQYTSNLIRLLPRTQTEIIDIDDKIKLEYAKLTETFSGHITLNEKPPVFVPSGSIQPKVPNKKQDTLQNIIDKVNERFEGKFTDADRVIIEGIYQMFMKDSDVKKFKKYAKDNSTEMFVESLFPDKFKDIVTQCFLDNNEAFQKLFNDPDFYQKVQDEMAKELYKSLRKD